MFLASYISTSLNPQHQKHSLHLHRHFSANQQAAGPAPLLFSSRVLGDSGDHGWVKTKKDFALLLFFQVLPASSSFYMFLLSGLPCFYLCLSMSRHRFSDPLPCDFPVLQGLAQAGSRVERLGVGSTCRTCTS